MTIIRRIRIARKPRPVAAWIMALPPVPADTTGLDPFDV
jgi:hypothetical protein